jgi:hypothetical protein
MTATFTNIPWPDSNRDPSVRPRSKPGAAGADAGRAGPAPATTAEAATNR